MSSSFSSEYISASASRVSYWEQMSWRNLKFTQLSKVISRLLWFYIATLVIGQKNPAPPIQPIRSETKTNRDLLERVFSRLAPATCISFWLWLVHWIVCVFCDWTEWLLWLWFYLFQKILKEIKNTIWKKKTIKRNKYKWTIEKMWSLFTYMLVDLRRVFLKWREIDNLLLLVWNLMIGIIITQTGIVLKHKSWTMPWVMRFTKILKKKTTTTTQKYATFVNKNNNSNNQRRE